MDDQSGMSEERRYQISFPVLVLAITIVLEVIEEEGTSDPLRTPGIQKIHLAGKSTWKVHMRGNLCRLMRLLVTTDPYSLVV
ncbi:hypothetical protein GQ53DRAFT_136274 [Thozetella sp. PMI_491]|nr:hypothetical protein GQ53DRAFT_136274 [Thozetella sp. PMI_491]